MAMMVRTHHPPISLKSNDSNNQVYIFLIYVTLIYNYCLIFIYVTLIDNYCLIFNVGFIDFIKIIFVVSSFYQFLIEIFTTRLNAGSGTLMTAYYLTY